MRASISHYVTRARNVAIYAGEGGRAYSVSVRSRLEVPSP